MNKTIALLFTACLLLQITLKADTCSGELLDKTNNLLKMAAEIEVEINSKQKVLENLKSREIRSIWDVVSRNSRENSLQRRNRLVLEISAMQEKSTALKSQLSSSLTVLLESMDKCASDEVFGTVFASVVKIRVSEMLTHRALTEAEISSSGTDSGAVEFLRYRLDMQEKLLEDTYILIEALKASKTAFMKADRAVPAAVIETLTGELLTYAESLKHSSKFIRKITDRSVQ